MDILHKDIIYIYGHYYNYLFLLLKRCKNFNVIITLVMCYILLPYHYSFAINPTRQASENSNNSEEQQTEESQQAGGVEEVTSEALFQAQQRVQQAEQKAKEAEQRAQEAEKKTAKVKAKLKVLNIQVGTGLGHKEYAEKGVQTTGLESLIGSSSQSAGPFSSQSPAAMPESFIIQYEKVIQDVIMGPEEEEEEGKHQQTIEELQQKVDELEEEVEKQRASYEDEIANIQSKAFNSILMLQKMLKHAKQQMQKTEIEKLEAQQLVAVFQTALLEKEGEQQASESQQSLSPRENVGGLEDFVPLDRESDKSPKLCISPYGEDDQCSEDSMPPLEDSEHDPFRSEYASLEHSPQSGLSTDQTSQATTTTTTSSSSLLLAEASEGEILSPIPKEEGSNPDLLRYFLLGSASPENMIGEVVEVVITDGHSGEEEQSNTSEDEESLSPPSKRRRTHSPSARSPRSPSSRADKSMLVPGYNHESQYGSLKGLQCVLFGAVEQTSNNLKTLVLKTNAYTAGKKNKLTMNNRLIPIGSKKGYMSLVGKKQLCKGKIKDECASSNLRSLLSFCHVFGHIDTHLSNLEHKACSGKFGLLMNPVLNMSLGVVYNRYKDHGKEYHGTQLDTSLGLAKANMELDGFSAVIAWNAEEKGVTGYVSGCHNWGEMKNTRQVKHLGEELRTKGSPDVTLSGILGQLGYMFPLVKGISCSPYVEATHIIVKWNQYNEHTGSLPCTISGYTEQFQERNIGLRTSWKVTDTTTLQAWIAGGSIRHTIGSITSMPLVSPIPFYKTSVPGNKKEFMYSECGTLCEVKLTDFCSIDLHGSLRCKKDKTIDIGQMRLHFQYSF